jgi:DNA helicase-2/ATP-dependent DNA helicase PcrA
VARLLEGLDPDQRRAVTHGEGPLLIVAGAGTGKTQVITRRIAWLIATRRARPSQILALTFTDRAAAEMAARVDRLVPYGYVDTEISTFHAFGDRLLREFAFELGLPSEPRVLSRPEVVIFLREHLFELGLRHYRPLGDPTRFLAALADLFSRAKDEDVSPTAYLEYAARLAAEVAEAADPQDPQEAERLAALREVAEHQEELARAYARYCDLLARSGFVDFGDQVALALQLLRQSASARGQVQARFRYVLVDEFQDTNRAQAELVGLLVEPHRNLTVVGDDDQSIYKFRGAAISNILEFERRYRGCRRVVLRRNYRSRGPILAAAYRLIRFNDPDRLEVRSGINKELVAVRDLRRSDGRGAAGVAEPPAAPVRVERFATVSDEADWVAGEIRRRLAAGARPRDHAILVRSNAAAEPFLRSLNMVGIPWRFSGSSGLYARPEVRLLLAFLRVLANPDSTVDLYALATSQVYGLGGPDLSVLMDTARRRNRSLWELLGELEADPATVRLTSTTREALARLRGDLLRFLELAHRRSAGEVLYAFLRDAGLLARWADPATAEAAEAVSNVARFFDVVRAQSAILSDDRVPIVVDRLRTLVEAGDDPPTAEIDPDADAVAVLTVHKAKGLEWPTVFLVGLVDGRFPVRERREALELPAALVRETLPEGDATRQEERRLFYVGMTRARDELILTYAVEEGTGRPRRVSPFVLEALDLPTAAETTAEPAEGRATEMRLAAERLAAFAPLEATPTPSPRPPEGPLTLSYYAVDDYLTCPLRYRYAHLLRIPVAPHHSLVYGAALHAAVQEFHRRQMRGELMSEEDLLAAFEAAWSNEGFISRAHEEARLEAGRQALRRFRETQLRPQAPVPRYVEREFVFGLDGDRVRGRIDRVDVGPSIDGEGAGRRAGRRLGPPEEDGPEPLLVDAAEPVLALEPDRPVTILDYKSGEVVDPARARRRARESLQLAVYALAWQALSGRLPDRVGLYFLETGVAVTVPVEVRRLQAAREKIRQAAAGIRAATFDPRPDPVTCGFCPYREICPASALRRGS